MISRLSPARSRPSASRIQVLAFIFFNEQERFPTLAEVKEHKFFKKTTVPQLDTWQPPPIQFSSSMREVLRAVKEDRPVRCVPSCRVVSRL